MFFYPNFEQFLTQPYAWLFMPTIYPQNLPVEKNENENALTLNHQKSEETHHQLCPLPIIIRNTDSSPISEKKFDSYIPKKTETPQKQKKALKDEEEFIPYGPEIRKSRRTPQNANRNVVPNIMHQVISYLQKKSKSQKMVEHLIEKLGLGELCTSKRFYFYQILIKDKLNHYVNVESLEILKTIQEPCCDVYSKEQQKMYNKISRILVQHFLSREYDSIILTSKRVNTIKRKDHIVVRRKILQHLSQVFSE